MWNLLLKLALGSLLVVASALIDGAREAPGGPAVASLPNPANVDGSGAGSSSPAVAPHSRVLIADAAR